MVRQTRSPNGKRLSCTADRIDGSSIISFQIVIICKLVGHQTQFLLEILRRSKALENDPGKRRFPFRVEAWAAPPVRHENTCSGRRKSCKTNGTNRTPEGDRQEKAVPEFGGSAEEVLKRALDATEGSAYVLAELKVFLETGWPANIVDDKARLLASGR